MKKKNFIYIFVVVFIFICFSTFIFIREKQHTDEKKDLQRQIEEESNKVTVLNEKIHQLEADNNNDASSGIKQCTYTQTYFYLGDYPYQGTVLTSRFIIMDKYQTQSPTIFEIDRNKFDIEFEERQAYEITFTSIFEDGIEFKRGINKIVKTDKLGMDQVQDPCRFD